MATRKKIDWIKISSFLSAIAALIIVVFTYLQIREFGNSTKADFTHRFKTDFFTEQSCTLMTLFDNDLLIFDTITNKNGSNDFGYFRIDTTKTKELKIKFPSLFVKTNYSVYEIDNYLLNHFNDLGQFYKKGILDIDYIYNGFDYYVESIYENKQIKEFLKWVKTDESSKDTYDGIDFIYLELKDYRKKHSH